MFEVFYHARCGNGKSVCRSTEELAGVIAAELGVKAKDITTEAGPTKDAQVLLGCSCYGDKPGGNLSQFIAENDFEGRQVALFGTSLISVSDKVKRVEELLKPAGALLRGSFFCRRRALPFLHRGSLSEEELANARRFASEMKGA